MRSGEKGARVYEDVRGFCKSHSAEEIEAHGFVLTPGRYVGAEDVEEDSESFQEKMKRLVEALNEQFDESAKLQKVNRAPPVEPVVCQGRPLEGAVGSENRSSTHLGLRPAGASLTHGCTAGSGTHPAWQRSPEFHNPTISARMTSRSVPEVSVTSIMNAGNGRAF